MDAERLPDSAFQMAFDRVSNANRLVSTLKCIKGPLSLRRMLGLSQSQVGRLLGRYTGKGEYTQPTISNWERPERGVRMPAALEMTDAARSAYRSLLADVLQQSSDGRYHLRARLGRRRWRFRLEVDCAVCGRPFLPERADIVRCRRHRRAGRA
jgi:transcriptional regulator with XRE-family HTH domain